MKYTQLTQEYKEDTLVEALYARELEYFHYDFDRVNFEKMLELLPNGEFRDLIQTRLKETLVQMKNVEKVYEALESQIVDHEAHKVAIARALARREADQNKKQEK